VAGHHTTLTKLFILQPTEKFCQFIDHIVCKLEMKSTQKILFLNTENFINSEELQSKSRPKKLNQNDPIINLLDRISDPK
jgi:hypothetical protein